MTRLEKLEAVAQAATEGWRRLETMYEEQEAYLKKGEGLPSWPRDKFESYLDWLKSEAEEALKP